MFDPGEIYLPDFDYPLPADRIAQYPLAERDASRLLIYESGMIRQEMFSSLDRFLPDRSLLVFNDTKVFRARILFPKSTGTRIELFCLEPVSPVSEIQQAFLVRGSCTWKCLVGNLKRWKSGDLVKEVLVDGEPVSLFASRKENLGEGCFTIGFRWDPSELSFSDVLVKTGQVPLPPYISRETVPSDSLRYQTIYAENEGSVAAPTAGLHFTERIFQKLREKRCLFEKVTLHVGVGTFRPVSGPGISDHIMHREKIMVKRKAIKSILDHLGEPVIAVGTTSARTIESLYWLGVKLARDKNLDNLTVGQWEAYHYQEAERIPVRAALETLVEYLASHHQQVCSGETQLMIVPGYRFRLVSGLITNFHMPQSTLLLLVAALIGNEWKNAYMFALDKDFRFLSYGDACLFFKNV